tara:strand:- start:99 stop:1166 length:1068 start_codon:yes stop_codon:yes gene_type:complete
MATLTVAGVDDALREIAGSPNATPAEFKKELNLALPRLYAMGMWRDLLFEHVITTSGSTFTIPSDAESIISAVVDYDSSSVDFSTPQEVRSQFHDYRITGRDDDGDTLRAYGIVDDGYSATVDEPVAGKAYRLRLRSSKRNTALPRGAGFTVHVTYSDGTNTSDPNVDEDDSSNNGGKFTCDGEDTTDEFLTTNAKDITSISEIRVGSTTLPEPVQLVMFETAADGSYANVHDSESFGDLVAATDLQFANEVTRYRRYRISNDEKKTIAVRCLLKRKFKPIISDEDPIFLSSLPAIKHALLGNIAEDNADLERANYHWGVCRALLDEQLDASRGAAKPAVRFDPSGVGAYTSNMM